MTDVLLVVGMLSAIAAFIVATVRGSRRAERKEAATKAERQAQRDRDIDMLREVELRVNWAMQRTPSDWVR